jgi:hypothetical protein
MAGFISKCPHHIYHEDERGAEKLATYYLQWISTRYARIKGKRREKVRKKNMLRKQLLRAMLCGYMLVLTVACAASSTSTQPTAISSPHATSTAAVQATATSLPAGTVLFQANWAQGLSQWQASGGWQIIGGQLGIENDSGDPATLIIPYQPTVANYAIEIRLQIVRLPHEGGDWDIFAQKQPGKDGYQADVFSLMGTEKRPFGEHPSAMVSIDPYSDASPGTGIPIDYEPGFKWHTYRVEVRDNAARFLDNGSQIGYANSVNTDMLSNGSLGLSCTVVVLRVSSLRILSL